MMLENYLKTAMRSFLTHRLFSFINLVGLSIGLAAFLLIMIFVRYELSYESFFDKAERIYRISQNVHSNDGSPDIEFATNSPQVAPLLKEEFPQVEQSTRLSSWRAPVSRDGTPESFADALMADHAIFEIFDFVWLQGSAEEALVDPDSVVLTETAARRYFGDGDPLGKSLVLGNNYPMRVVGVIQDLPRNTHLAFDMLVPITMATSVISGNALENWSWQNYHTYILLAEGSDIADLEAQFPAFIDRHIQSGANSVSFSMTGIPLSDIHLHSNRQYELSPPGSMATVNAFIVIAFLVLLVACMNFMNLSTVKAVQRAREVGMRKVLGGVKSQIMFQFLGESVLLTAVAVLVALGLVELALPAFGALLQRELTFSLVDNAVTLPFLVLLTLFVSLVSSGYPSFYLSSYNPALVLKGIVTHGKGAAAFRNALVVLQFSVAVALLIATATIYSQLNFLRSMDPGYDREQIVVLDNTGREGLGRQWDLLKQELLNDPEVLAVTASNIIPTEEATAGYYIDYEGGAETRSMPLMLVDYGYFETYGISPMTGRVFSQTYGQDRRRPFSPDTPQTSGTYVLNGLAASQLGWTPTEAIGKWIEVTCCNFGRGVVVGVVGNVHYGSLRDAAAPVIYMIPPEVNTIVTQETRLGLRQAAIRISGRQVQDTLSHIEASWKKYRSDQPISLRFLEGDFNGLYRDEERQGEMMASFSILAVLITCMGLFGLATYNAHRRTKEVGIRKVMGSSVWGIVLLLTNDFSRLVLLSNVIAWPVAWFAMNRWLENFAYRIDLTPVVFIGSGMIALCIAWVTVGGTAAKAATQKPVLALRYE